jgi:GxxExxY protein
MPGLVHGDVTESIIGAFFPVGSFRADLVVDGRVIVESKATERILPIHERQLLHYLEASGLTVGLVLNFGPRASFRRLILSPRG